MKRCSLMHGVRVAFVICGLALSNQSIIAQTFVGTNGPGSAQNFAFTPVAGSTNLAVAVAGSGGAYSHLLLRAGIAPTDTDYDFIAQLDGANNAINLESPEFKLTNYFVRVRTPSGSLTHVFTLNVLTNVADMRNASRPATKPLVSTSNGSLSAAGLHYYRIEIPTNNSASWRLVLSSTNGVGPDLYMKRDDLPTLVTYDKRSQTTTNDILAFTDSELTAGAYFVGVHQPSGTANYTLRSEFITVTTLAWDPGDTHLGTQVYVHPNTNAGDHYFKITVQNTAEGAWRTALNVLSSNADIYLAKGTLPAPNSHLYKSERTNASDGFVVPASAFSAGEDWYYLVQARAGAQWNLVTGAPYVTDLGTVATDASSGSGNVIMGAEGTRFFKTTVPVASPAWRLYLNGQTNTILVKKGGVPVPGATEQSQPSAMLVVPPYLVGGQLYFIGISGTPGLTNDLDSRQQTFEDIPFLTSTNVTVSPNQGLVGYPYRTFRVQVPFDQLAWQISTLVSNGNPNLAVRRNFIPNENYNDAYSEIASNITDSITLVPTNLSDGTFYITTYSTSNYTCQLTSGNPEITEINYVDTVTNTDTNRTGWRFFRVSDIPQQLGTLGWDLYVTNHTPGTRIAVRRNAAPGSWNYRNPNPAVGGAVDAVGPAGTANVAPFLQRPGHQADTWYVGVFNTNAALGAFTLVTKHLTAELISFDTGFATRTDVPAGKWQYFRVDVPAGIVGWDARVINVSTGSPRLVVRRELLPISQSQLGFNNGLGSSNWLTGDQWPAGSDYTRRDLSPTGQNEAGRSLTVGYHRPLTTGTYYIGVTSQTGTTNDMSYTLLSRGIGDGYAIPVVEVEYTNGVIANTMPAREIAVYRVTVPSNAPSWKLKIANTLGDCSLALAQDRLPNSAATLSAEVTDPATLGKRQGRIGNEHFLQLPIGFATNVPPGPYYLIVQSEGQINPNPTNTTRIGPGDCAYTLTSYGPLPEVDLGLLTTNGLTYTAHLEGGEAAALHFQNTFTAEATGFELNLDPASGQPAIVSSPFNDLANPGSQNLGGGGVPLDPYGNDGGFNSVASYDIITVADPYADETVMIKPRGAGVNWPDSDFTLRLRKLVPAPVPFDGGAATVVGQTNLYEFFKIEVPTHALGWDLRLTNVTGAPLLLLTRDVLPLLFNTSFPGDSETWPSGALWIAAKDWTQRSSSAAGVNEDGRLIACGMGRPLEPGTYYAAAYNSSGTPVSYTIVSRGIGSGFSIPVIDVPFNGGSITNLSLAPREAAYYRLVVPEGAVSWQGRLTTLAGEALLVNLTNSIPSVLSGRSGDPGLVMQKPSNEHFVVLPQPGTNVLLPGTNYFAVVSEGITNASFPTRIGTNVSSYVFESRGQLQVVNLGSIGLEEARHTNSLQGGEVQAYQFDVPPGVTSLEARVYTTTGRPVQVLRVGALFPNPGLASTFTGAGSVSPDGYGSDGGQTITPLTGNAGTNLITVVNPTNGTYTIMVKARAVTANNYPNATYTLGVRALSYADVTFDGGSAVVTNQGQNSWRYFKVEVPPGALGWDVRLANVVSGLPEVVVCRDTLPVTTLPVATKPWSSPSTVTNWPTTNQWAAGSDWTRRTFSANNATNEEGRILAMGMGQPLEPGTYWIGVYGAGSTNVQYTLLSRGIGDGMSLPVVDLNYAGGSATVSNLAPREAVYFRVQVPSNSPGWKIKFAPTAGEAMLLVLSNAVPNVDSGRSVNIRSGKALQKAGNEHYVLLPLPGQSTIYAGTYYLAAVSEGVNPASATRIGTDASSFTITSLGDVPVTNLGPVTLTDIVRNEELGGGESRLYQFTINPGTAAVEMRLENRIGNPVMVLITNTPLPDPGGLSNPKDLYGNDGGDAPDLIHTNIITVANPVPGTYSLAVKARAAGVPYPDAAYTLRVRQLAFADLNFTAEFNTNGLNHVASGSLLDSQRAFYRVNVPTNVHGAPVLGWELNLSQLSGVASVRVRKDELPSDAVPGIPFAPSAAVIVPPVLVPGTWYVEVRGSNSTQFTLESSTVRLQRPAWAMPAVGQTNVAPGLAWPEFADSGVHTNGVPLPGTNQAVNLEAGKFHFYAVNVPTNNGALLRVQLVNYSGNPNFYQREEALPTVSHRTNGLAGGTFNRALAAGTASEYGNFVPIDGKKDLFLPPGTWYVAVHAAGTASAEYRLRLSVGQIQDLDLDGGTLAGQTVNGSDWQYYRVFVPLDAPTNWLVTFTQPLGDVVLHLRDAIPPGNGYTNAPNDIRDWETDAKNSNGTTPPTYDNYDAEGTYPLAIPPVRPGTTYYLGFRGKIDSTFTVTSTLSGDTHPPAPLIPFYGGYVTNTLPPGALLAYRISTPADALRWRHTSVHLAGVQFYLENGTWPTRNANDDFRSTTANSGQDRLLTAYPWLPNQTYYLVITNTTGATQSFSLTMNGSSVTDDSDADGMTDGWEMQYFGNITATGTQDSDSDGVSNLNEFLEATNPTDKNSLRPRLTLISTNGTVLVQSLQSNLNQVVTGNWTNIFALGTNATLTPTPSNGYQFVSWNIGTTRPTANPLVLTLTSNTTAIARFRVPADDFDQRILLSGFNATSSGLNSTNASKEPGEPPHAANNGGHSLWWSWTAPLSGAVTLQTTGNYRHSLAIYTGNAVNALATVTNVMAAAGTTSNTLTFNATGGTTYQIAVDGFSSAVGTVSLNLSQAGALVLSNPVRQGDGLFHFTITSPAGAVLTVQASTNLVHWTQIAIVTNASGTMDFADPASATLPLRYYRVGPLGATPAAMTLAGATRQPDGSLRFTVNGVAGQVFRVLAHTNLSTTNWMTIASLTNVTGSLQYTDTTATNHPSRFYRTVSP